MCVLAVILVSAIAVIIVQNRRLRRQGDRLDKANKTLNVNIRELSEAQNQLNDVNNRLKKLNADLKQKNDELNQLCQGGVYRLYFYDMLQLYQKTRGSEKEYTRQGSDKEV